LFSGTPNKEGHISFRYLPTASFDVLIFEDLNFDGNWNEPAEPFGFTKNLPSGLDSSMHSVPYFNSTFNEPEENSATFLDSIAMVIDTARPENVGRLKLVVPKADTTVRAWLSHESGYLQSFTFAPYRGTSDTTVIDLGNQLPGKYAFRGFFDINGDSVWTPASWYTTETAEPLLKEQTFELKANWDLEQPLSL
jgi:uncharacterized protein (DUF2141 family)